MKIETTRFGTLNVGEDSVLRIEGGILGFGGKERYVLLEFDSMSPFKWLQSVEDPDLAFVVIDPRLVKEDYRVPVDGEDIQALDIERVEDCLVYTIVTIGRSPEDVTVNLLGPILINSRNKRARQLVLVDSDYSVRHRIVK